MPPPVCVIGSKAPVFTVAIDYFIVQTTVTCRGIDVHKWINQILQKHRNRLHQLIVGLVVDWRSGVNIRTPVSVLQICVGFRCLVFQVFHADFLPPNLLSFLSDRRFRFVGVRIHSDAERLSQHLRLHVGNTVDLRALAVNRMRREDLRDSGIKQLAEEVLRLDVDKPEEIAMSNWASNLLSYDQIAHACADAFLSFEIGKRLFTGQF